MSRSFSNFFLRNLNYFGILFKNYAKGGTTMKTRTWIVIFALLLALCVGASFYFLMPGEASAHAEITSHGQVVKTVDLRIDQEFVISPADGQWNTISVKDGKIGVTEASCPDHYCMKRGFCNSGTEIVCLPNRMTIRFLGTQEIDAIIG